MPERANFDQAEPSDGVLRRHLKSLIEILALDDVEACDLLFGLSERAVS